MNNFFYFFKSKCATGGNKIKNNGIDTFIKELERYKNEWNFKKSICIKSLIQVLNNISDMLLNV